MNQPVQKKDTYLQRYADALHIIDQALLPTDCYIEDVQALTLKTTADHEAKTVSHTVAITATIYVPSPDPK